MLEDRIDADLALGLHADLVAELESLVGDFPLRERPRGQLMIALYRCGRQVEALEVYADARRLLKEELGLEPSAALNDLQRAILEHDLSLSPPSEREAPLAWGAAPSAPGAFVGREAELQEVQRGLADALAGRGRLVLISGEPGIGKSRLADELLRDARGRGMEVLVGRCWEAGGAPAFWPWVQALRVAIGERDPDRLRRQLGQGASDLAELFPELRQLFPDLPAPFPLESEGARFRLFEAIATFIHNAASNRPLVIVLDDLHAADEPSLLLLEFLARELDRSRLLVVGAYRNVDPVLGDPLVRMLSGVAREPTTRRIALTGLAEKAVSEYVSIASGSEADAATAAAIHAETEGNPLFVSELVRLLAAEGRLGLPNTPLGIPTTVREVISSRLQRLSEPCREAVTVASVLGREFAFDALGEVSGLSRDDLLDALDEALAERVIGEVSGTAGTLRFAHVLIRDALYDGLTMAQRLRLHRRAGDALETLYSGNLEPHLAELAHHFLAAAPAGAAQQAIDYARRAGTAPRCCSPSRRQCACTRQP